MEQTGQLKLVVSKHVAQFKLHCWHVLLTSTYPVAQEQEGAMPSTNPFVLQAVQFVGVRKQY